MTAEEDESALRKELGRGLKTARARAGLLQRELAHKMGYSRSRVAGAEVGDCVSQQFWERCDAVLGTTLAQGHAVLRTLRRQRLLAALGIEPGGSQVGEFWQSGEGLKSATGREMPGDSVVGGVDAMWRELGRQLAALRRAAGLTQAELAALTAFSRTTVSLAEIGRASLNDEFWQACDKALGTGEVLADGAGQIRAARSATEHAAACAAQEAREARALAAFVAARDQRGVTAGVSAVQPCPNCGCQVTVLTTLIPGAAGGGG